jgi:hypothetical protein
MRVGVADLHAAHLAALQLAHFLHELSLKRLKPAGLKNKQVTRSQQTPLPAALRRHALHSSRIGINLFAVKLFLPAHVARQEHRPSDELQDGVPVTAGSSQRIVPRKRALAARAQAHRAPGDDVPRLSVAVAKMPLENDVPAELSKSVNAWKEERTCLTRTWTAKMHRMAGDMLTSIKKGRSIPASCA